ncbi:tetratricopeptide repeat protein [Tenacibaculum sp. 190524A02b]|uniref:tetratricopeptide repeat protein n=1 Tax=Tenacibaculum vairaonense TaxID=3137860 RepID=UPI0031FAF604
MSKKLPLVIITFFSLITSICSQKKIDSLQQVLQNASTKETKLKILDKLTLEMVRTNHSEQWKYLNQTILLAKKIGNYDLAASKTRFIAQRYIYGGKADSAIHVVEQLLKYKKKFTTPKSEGHLLLKRGAAYFNKELLKEAAKDYDKSAELFMKFKDSIYAADALFFAGQVYSNSNEFLKSIERLEKAYNLYNMLGDKVYANYTLNELSILYGKNGFHDKAIYERKRILKNAKIINKESNITYAYAHLFTSYFKKGNLNTARSYLDSVTISKNKIVDNSMRESLSFRLSGMNVRYFLKKNNLDSAYIYLKSYEKKLKKENVAKYHKNTFLYYAAKFYNKKGKYAKAQKYLEELLDKNNKVGDAKMILEANKEMSQVLANQNKFNKSYKYLKYYTDNKEIENSRIKKNTFLYHQSHFETERKDIEIYKNEAQIKLLEKDKEIAKAKRKTLLILLIAIIFIAILVGYFIWKQGVRKRKALSNKLERNKKELNRYTKQLIEKSKLQELLDKEIEELKEEIGQHKSSEKLQDLTTVKILTNDDWYDFKEKFRSVYPNFFASIKNKGFELTKAEERLIAMEKLYLDTNEIASMLAISQDSVTRSRSRLRKKINAPKGVPILEYLEAS